MPTHEQFIAELADRYRIDRELGRGGMAIVFLAEDLKHSRNVALKVLHHELGDSRLRERFFREIAIAARLAHPNILPLYDSGAAAGQLFYVTPYLEGESLRAWIDRERRLSLNVAITLAGEVADALDYAHRSGVIHRDIKPDNILISDGHAIVRRLRNCKRVCPRPGPPDCLRIRHWNSEVYEPGTGTRRQGRQTQ